MDESKINQLREITNGGGLVSPHVLISKTALLSAPAQARDSAELLGKAAVMGESVVWNHGKVMNNAVVWDSDIHEHARISGNARVERSKVFGTAEIMERAYVSGSNISGNAMIMGDAEVIGCSLACNIRVLDNAKLFNVVFVADLNNNAVIEGDAELDFPYDNMYLNPNTRISEGYWTRPPKVIDTPVFPTIESAGDRVQIGCLNHSLKFWYEHGKDVLVGYGLDPDLYPRFEEAMNFMRDFKKMYKSPSVRRRRK